jgi:hypothetical protein
VRLLKKTLKACGCDEDGIPMRTLARVESVVRRVHREMGKRIKEARVAKFKAYKAERRQKMTENGRLAIAGLRLADCQRERIELIASRRESGSVSPHTARAILYALGQAEAEVEDWKTEAKMWKDRWDMLEREVNDPRNQDTLGAQWCRVTMRDVTINQGKAPTREEER